MNFKWAFVVAQEDMKRKIADKLSQSFLFIRKSLKNDFFFHLKKVDYFALKPNDREKWMKFI